MTDGCAPPVIVHAWDRSDVESTRPLCHASSYVAAEYVRDRPVSCGHCQLILVLKKEYDKAVARVRASR